MWVIFMSMKWMLYAVELRRKRRTDESGSEKVRVLKADACRTRFDRPDDWTSQATKRATQMREMRECEKMLRM